MIWLVWMLTRERFLKKVKKAKFNFSYIYMYIYNFTVVKVSQVIIVLLLQNCFIWYKDHTHQAILTMSVVLVPYETVL